MWTFKTLPQPRTTKVCFLCKILIFLVLSCDLSRHKKTSEVIIMEGGMTQHYKLYENQIRSMSSIRPWPQHSVRYSVIQSQRQPWGGKSLQQLTKATLWGFLASKQNWYLYLEFLTKHSNVLNPFNATFFHCPALLTCTTVSKTPPSFTQEIRFFQDRYRKASNILAGSRQMWDFENTVCCWITGKKISVDVSLKN